jgi:type VI secretion system protein ImpM
MTPPTHSLIGTFGKLPSAGDFVAHNAGQPVARALVDWLEREVDGLAARGIPLPSATVHFLYRDPAGTGACLGALLRSRDKVGRKFPFCIFTYMDVRATSQRYPSLPAAYAPFIDGAVSLLQRLEPLTADDVVSQATALPLPRPDELEAAHLWSHQALEHTGGQTLLEALFGPLDQGVRFHGLHMLLTACAQVHGADPGSASIILECPASDDVQLTFWLRLCQQRLGWGQAPPGLFWSGSDSSDSRLLITLGAPTPGVLGFLAQPDAVAERLWPMRTTSASSIAAGRQALGPTQRAVLDPPAPTAAAILAALAG